MPCYDNMGGALRRVMEIDDTVSGALRKVGFGYDNIGGALREYHKPLEATDIAYIEFRFSYKEVPAGYESMYSHTLSTTDISTSRKYSIASTSDRSGANAEGNGTVRRSFYSGNIYVHLVDGNIIMTYSELLEGMDVVVTYSCSYSGSGSSYYLWYSANLFAKEKVSSGTFTQTLPANSSVANGIGLERGSSGSSELTVRSIMSGSLAIPFCFVDDTN